MGVLRFALAPVAMWLAAHGIISQDEVVQAVVEMSAIAVGVLLVVLRVIKSEREKRTALAMEKGSTPDELKRKMRRGEVAKVTTPADQPTTIVRKR